MDAKKIKFLVELKIGSKMWRKDSTLEAPFPAPLQEEIRAVLSGRQWPPTIEIIERIGSSPPPKTSKVEDIPVSMKVATKETSSSEALSTVESKKEKTKKKPPIRKQ